MRVVPKDNLGAIQFYETHAPVWLAAAPSIGLTPEDAAAVADAAAAARAALKQQYAAQQAALTATQACENALDRLRTTGAACVARIRVAATAAGDGGGSVYALAQLPMPARPGRLPAPGTPTGFAATLLADGAVRLTWRCPNPPGAAGTVYEIRRSDLPAAPPSVVPGAGGPEWTAPAFVGLAGTKSFLDDTIPPGTAAVQYQVTAVRPTRRGAPARYTVMFAAGRAAAA